MMRERASAKINLFLHITGRRADGYHLLDSLVVFADAADTVEALPASDLTLTLSGPFAHAIIPFENSVLRAARTLRDYGKVAAGAALTLHKHLPVAAGLGGGSADAAATLRLLRRFWEVEISDGDLASIALSLGADVPACLHSTSLYMGGIGENILSKPVLAGMHMVLVNPGKPLATPQVFSAYTHEYSAPAQHPLGFASVQDAVNFLRGTRNDLQAAATRLMPEIGPMLEKLAGHSGCLLARMSGSGATCFGIFSGGEASQKAAALMALEYPDGWAISTEVR